MAGITKQVSLHENLMKDLHVWLQHYFSGFFRFEWQTLWKSLFGLLHVHVHVVVEISNNDSLLKSLQIDLRSIQTTKNTTQQHKSTSFTKHFNLYQLK